MINKSLLYNLYSENKLSMVEISNKLRVTPKTVEYWLEKYDIPRRSCSESAYVKQNPKGDPFRIKRELNSKDKELLTIGLMLYWAEGNKNNKTLLQLVNLDYRMLQLFLKFLRGICKIDEKRLRLYVRLYKNFNKKVAKQHWAKLLNVSKEQIFVYPHTDTRSKVGNQWSEYGIATLQFSNTKLKKWLDNKIDAYINKQIADQRKN